MIINGIKQILNAIRSCAPKSSKVVVLHAECVDILDLTILQGIDYLVLPADGKVHYLSLKIVFNAIKYCLVNWSKARLFGVRQFIYQAYLLGCLEQIAPKIVITFIDNSGYFQDLNRAYDQAEFYAIQNGVKGENDVKHWLPKPPHKGSVISLENLVCFGQHEIDLYTKYGHLVDRYYPVGSLIGGYYKSQMGQDRRPTEFDLCLVSQWRKSIMSGQAYPELKRGLDVLNAYLGAYLQERGLSLCIATCVGDQAEVEYYRNIYGQRGTIIKQDRLKMSTYRAMDSSRVVLALDSCAAWEAFGWGKKVLFCNFTGDQTRDFVLPGIWSLNKADYQEFREKIDHLLGLDEDKYGQAHEKSIKYVMNYDRSMPAHILMRNKISETLATK